MYPSQTTPPSTLQDPLRVPRRQMDPEDIIDILRRNKSWIAAPALLGLVIAVVVAHLWPDTYVSVAQIRVVPSQVPERLVPSVVNIDMNESIQSMAQSILSRSTLTSVVEQYGLYPRQQKDLPMEDILDQMGRAIQISPVSVIRGGRRGQEMTAFQVAFRYENRYLAQKVAGDIVSRFINENTREKANRAAMTTQFLKDNWQMAKSQLDELERKRTEFQVRYAGQLPDQWPVRMQQINAVDSRISNLNAAISRLNQDKLMREGEMRLLQDRISGLMQGGPIATSYADPTLARYDDQLRNAERQLMNYLEVYTTEHPDVQRFQAQIDVLRREREKYLEQKNAAPATGENAESDAPQQPMLSEGAVRDIRDTRQRIANLQLQVKSIDMQIEDATRQIGQHTQRLNQLQGQLQSAPMGEQEWVELNRDYALARRRYDELNLKMAQSQMATDLENRKQGETLELLDAASLPETPSEPNRPVMIMMGLAAGLGLGCVLVFLREIKDTSLKTLKDVRAYTQLVVLGSVPLLENDLVVMRRRRMAWLGWTAASVLSAIVMAGAVWYYYHTKA